MTERTSPHVAVQRIAKRVLAELADAITPESTERSLADWSVGCLATYGVRETWYHNCPALVLLGGRSCLSVSGRDYSPDDEPLGETNLVTVDLSPSLGGFWGDCARSFYIEQGRAVADPQSSDFRRGAELLTHLHEEIRRFLAPDKRFCDLHAFANGLIADAGFKNLDFLGNVGHSIASTLDGRVYADRDNTALLADVACFTFEPHVREVDGRWGFKHEEIYYFDERGAAQTL